MKELRQSQETEMKSSGWAAPEYDATRAIHEAHFASFGLLPTESVQYAPNGTTSCVLQHRQVKMLITIWLAISVNAAHDGRDIRWYQNSKLRAQWHFHMASTGKHS